MRPAFTRREAAQAGATRAGAGLAAGALDEPPSLGRRLSAAKLGVSGSALSPGRKALCEPRECASPGRKSKQEHEAESALGTIGQISNGQRNESRRCHLEEVQHLI
jgi:hypothetical protein